jgi:hypothetical protein
MSKEQPKDALGAKSEASRVKSGDLNKSEENPEVVMLKAELEANKAKSKELKDSLDTVATILTQMVKKTAPQGKAVMSLDVVRKSEVEEKPLSKSEVTAVLAKKAMDPSLSKQDRNLINAFYLDNASINSISHLLR